MTVTNFMKKKKKWEIWNLSKKKTVIWLWLTLESPNLVTCYSILFSNRHNCSGLLCLFLLFICFSAALLCCYPTFELQIFGDIKQSVLILRSRPIPFIFFILTLYIFLLHSFSLSSSIFPILLLETSTAVFQLKDHSLMGLILLHIYSFLSLRHPHILYISIHTLL